MKRITEFDAELGELLKQRSKPPRVDFDRVNPIGRYAPIPSAGPTWTLDDQREAVKQGWFVHFIDARICAATDGPAMRLHFSSDKVAQAFVGFRASLGDELAGRAFAYLADRLGLTQTAMLVRS